jgi:hypothetical protein
MRRQNRNWALRARRRAAIRLQSTKLLSPRSSMPRSTTAGRRRPPRANVKTLLILSSSYFHIGLKAGAGNGNVMYAQNKLRPILFHPAPLPVKHRVVGVPQDITREAHVSEVLINLILQAIGGAIGGNAVGNTLKNMNLGPLWNTIAGAAGGVGGGSILSTLIPALSSGGVDIGALATKLRRAICCRWPPRRGGSSPAVSAASASFDASVCSASCCD